MVQVRKLQPDIAKGRINNDAWVEQMQATLGLKDMSAIQCACELAQDISLQALETEDPDKIGNCFFAGLEIAEILAAHPDIEQCHILDERLGNKIQALRGFIKSLEAFRTIAHPCVYLWRL